MHIFHQKPQKFCMKMDLKLGESCFDSSQCAKKKPKGKRGEVYCQDSTFKYTYCR